MSEGPIVKVSVVEGDVRQMHQSPTNAGALFQVASQFNLLEMVSPEKQRRLCRAAEAWLAVNAQFCACEAQFDVAAKRNGKLIVVPDAF